MTVGELIEALSKHDVNIPVFISDSNRDTLYELFLSISDVKEREVEIEGAEIDVTAIIIETAEGWLN
ncbi:hypothetical protein HB904_04005 [Listeria booriae]|uniref:Uncharacterized protein n=1 Tax=Listeria booriae TaxID=1552123 RepID=A0A7X1A3E6_9LIST|nr:hypothetical protein [Listeria booriae]MBC1615336.1 hypothetical protein [Listeria booriae]MBC2370563.1 hypothetical protein [Listeria booriae]